MIPTNEGFPRAATTPKATTAQKTVVNNQLRGRFPCPLIAIIRWLQPAPHIRCKTWMAGLRTDPIEYAK
ncbi:hypothetical protein AS032_17820 [Rhodococcus qingshengii]|nr:hypothetical protein AS032_17820 [Rhodococcus qingshengii]